MESQFAQSLKATALKSITAAPTTAKAIKNRKLTGKSVCKNSIVSLVTTLPFPYVSGFCVLTLATDVLIPTTIGTSAIGTGEVPLTAGPDEGDATGAAFTHATGAISRNEGGLDFL
jgi:hypothetical protein